MCSLQREIAQLTGFTLPEDYLKLLQSYPQSFRQITRADDGSDREGCLDSAELIADLNDVLDINREVRRDSVLDPHGEECHWPDQVLVIGENGEGDYYGIDLGHEYPGVLFFDHQAVEFEQITDSLDDYVTLLQESFCP